MSDHKQKSITFPIKPPIRPLTKQHQTKNGKKNASGDIVSEKMHQTKGSQKNQHQIKKISEKATLD